MISRILSLLKREPEQLYRCGACKEEFTEAYAPCPACGVELDWTKLTNNQ